LSNCPDRIIPSGSVVVGKQHKDSTFVPRSLFPYRDTSISVLYGNVRSLIPKIDVLASYVSLYRPSIIALTETWLEKTYPTSLFCPPDYVAHRFDRASGRGGGVLILAKNDLNSATLIIHSPPALTDAIGCHIRLEKGMELGILCIY
jgi:hypothetical protein